MVIIHSYAYQFGLLNRFNQSTFRFIDIHILWHHAIISSSNFDVTICNYFKNPCTRKVKSTHLPIQLKWFEMIFKWISPAKQFHMRTRASSVELKLLNLIFTFLNWMSLCLELFGLCLRLHTILVHDIVLFSMQFLHKWNADYIINLISNVNVNVAEWIEMVNRREFEILRKAAILTNKFNVPLHTMWLWLV